MEENELISKIKAGDQRAFRVFVESHQQQVFNTCVGFLHHEADAEDVAQEVFIEVHRNIDRFKGDSKLSTWLYRIAVNKSLDFMRKKKRQKRWGFFQAVFGFDQIPEPAETSKGMLPGITTDDQDRGRVLFQAIDSLSENQRIAFTLHKLEGLSYQEVTEVMGLSLSSVESLMHRAKKNLQKKLANYYKKTLK
ncbi:MAG: RNA polymerase sigma factor [Flammeovirgaceae bacterium]